MMMPNAAVFVVLQHDEFYNNLLAGKSGITEISTFDASQFTTRFAGEVKVRTQTRRHDTFSSCIATMPVPPICSLPWCYAIPASFLTRLLL